MDQSVLEEAIFKLISIIEKDEFIKLYPSWKSQRKHSISSLRSIADDLDESITEANVGKTVGSGATISGGLALMVGGALLLPFSFGASSGLIAGASSVLIAGGAVATTIGVDTIDSASRIKKRIVKEVNSIVQKDSRCTQKLIDIIKQLTRHLPEEIDKAEIALDLKTEFSPIKELTEGSEVSKKIRKLVEDLVKAKAMVVDFNDKLRYPKRSKVDQEEEEDPEEGEVKKFLLAKVSVCTFNIKGTIQNDEYKLFLKTVFHKLNCHLYHLQESMWNNDSYIYTYILPNYPVSNNLRNDVGIASLQSVLDQEEILEDMPIPVLPERMHYHKISAKMTVEVSSKEAFPTQSSTPLQFLSFSFHGKYKVTHKCKEEQIITFIEFVVECCERVKLPPIVGGDFNYDIRLIPWESRHKITVFGGDWSFTSSSIDFLCTVCGDTYETKMVMLPFSVRSLDIEEIAPEGIQDKITNHKPWYGDIGLYKDLKETSS